MLDTPKASVWVCQLMVLAPPQPVFRTQGGLVPSISGPAASEALVPRASSLRGTIGSTLWKLRLPVGHNGLLIPLGREPEWLQLGRFRLSGHHSARGERAARCAATSLKTVSGSSWQGAKGRLPPPSSYSTGFTTSRTGQGWRWCAGAECGKRACGGRMSPLLQILTRPF